MKILVTCKRVVDPEAKIKLLSDGSGIVMDGINFAINPFDEIAVEEAIRIKEKVGGEIVAVAIAGDEAQQQLRTMLAMGADKAILVKEEGPIDSDLVARTLVKIVEKEQPDLVLMGKQAVDDDANQAVQLVAEYLGYGQACFASEVEMADDQKSIQVTREVDGGLETLSVQLPAVISADLRLNEPRLPKLPNIMKAKKKPLESTSFADLGVEPDLLIKTLGLEEPPSRKAGEIVPDVDTLLDKLKNEAKVI